MLASGFTFLEGPRWHDDALYVSDFYSRNVYRVSERGRAQVVCHLSGMPSGLGFSPDNRLLVVSMKENAVLLASPTGDSFDVYADLSGVQVGPANDMLVDANGRAYVGCEGSDLDAGEPLLPAPLVRIEPTGHASRVADGLMYPNGMAMSPDGAALLVAETLASRISVFDVGPDGDLGDRRVWAAFDETAGWDSVSQALDASAMLPDGIALDINGALWVGDANGHAALLVDEGGAIRDRVDTHDLAVYAVALGGRDLRTLFMCAAPPLSARSTAAFDSAVLLACRVDTPGVPTH